MIVANLMAIEEQAMEEVGSSQYSFLQPWLQEIPKHISRNFMKNLSIEVKRRWWLSQL
jgi:hypothetical protein